jgi:hypothetical protein
MKKLFVTAALIVAVITSSFAADVKVDKRIQTAFQKEFATAFNPKWEAIGEGLMHVTFTQNGEVMDAYYNEDAQLVSFARSVSVDQLPLLVSKAINEKFSGSQISDIRELVNQNETSYLVTARSESKIVVARVYPSGSIQIIKKVKTGKE